MRTFLVGIMAFLWLVINFSSPPRTSWAGEHIPGEKTKIKAVIYPYLTYTQFNIAQDEGFFAEQGLDVEYLKMPLAESIVALAQGQVDVVAGYLKINVLNAMARETGIKAVADKGYIPSQGCPSTAILIRKDLHRSGSIKGAAQLKGRKFAMDRIAIEGFYMAKLLGAAGLTLDDIVTNYVGNPAAEMEALGRGAVDFLPTTEPWVTRTLESGHGVVWKPAHQIIPDFQLGLIFYGPTILEGKIEAGKGFMVAYLQGVRQYNQGPTDRNLEILTRHTRMKGELLKKICWPPLRSDGSINISSVLEFQEWAVKNDLLDRAVGEDELWDPRFVDYANDVLGKADP